MKTKSYVADLCKGFCHKVYEGAVAFGGKLVRTAIAATSVTLSGLLLQEFKQQCISSNIRENPISIDELKWCSVFLLMLGLNDLLLRKLYHNCIKETDSTTPDPLLAAKAYSPAMRKVRLCSSPLPLEVFPTSAELDVLAAHSKILHLKERPPLWTQNRHNGGLAKERVQDDGLAAER
jgi:hypothetical protein